MEDAKFASTAKGLALSVAYCAAYLAAWNYSLDQWFLPAGIRAAALLFLPYRYWPYAFAGDTAALLVIRGPKADQYSPQWAYLSPFLLMPLISAVALIFRRQLKTTLEKRRWLPLVAASIALWSTLCNLGLNVALSGPGSSNSFEEYFRIAIGQYLGILILVPPLFVWLRRSSGLFFTDHLVRDAIIAAGMVSAMYCAIVLPHEPKTALTQGLLMLMMVPVVGLTFLHGWRGAAIGIVIVNLAIGLTLPRANLPGAYDATIFVVQQAVAVAATALLVLGTVISEHYDKARKSGVAEERALQLAQSSFLSTERNLRDQLLYMAQMQLHLDDERKELVEWLKAHGHYEAAMDLNTRGVAHARLFEEQAMALYPIRIEEQGLHAVMHSEAFSRFWAGEAEVRYSLRGQPRWLTVDLQLAAYRCACNAIALLSDFDPDEYVVKTRVWRFGNRRGIALFVTAKPRSAFHPTQAGTIAAVDLEARVKAHGGTVRRRHANRISLVLSEPVDAGALRH
ncbi:MAG: histidine kinase [Lysobacteraceae bacterium]|nr:MAG: histidine kinase [Xanthomonadaceae bacterium]